MACLLYTSAVAVLFALNLFWGSVSLAPGAVLTALLGKGGDALAGNIILQLRLPRAVMAALLLSLIHISVAEPLLGEVGSDATIINQDKEDVAKAVTAAAVKEAGYDSLDAAAADKVAFVLSLIHI